ncbi:hypothetical protein PSH89_23875 [Pseudomonas sp. FP1911]|uniref:hypothetical protein n=1 Tax=Pseudomonas sp. FP1911 TaxID=2954081 RepID=UPI0027355D49|nr:hypothetical protein [Pseudomonas sp. FP1911]WLG78934.1 hypothetical protein PSH89_23875 [Pseudomonas sp. FP1911]
MKYIFENLALAPELKDGEVWCSTYLTNQDDDLLPLARHLVSACPDGKNSPTVEIEVCFPLRSIVTERVESFQYGCSTPPMIDVNNRPLLDALRKELVEMVSILDSIKYVEE